ncbi:MAG: hypothetical protein WCH44_04970 [Betaproteobacteria bacterium]
MNVCAVSGPLPTRSPRREQGVVLYVALVAMIAMMLAGVAMLRSVAAGVGVAGNLAFKQNASLAGERGADKAVEWLRALPVATASTTLQAHDAANGYMAIGVPSVDSVTANVVNTFDPFTFDWDNATTPTAQQATADDGAGNRVRYVMHRLCKALGSSQPSSAQECAVFGAVLKDPTTGLPIGAPPRPLFRVTTRVDGPRNTVSYVQVVVN